MKHQLCLPWMLHIDADGRPIWYLWSSDGERCLAAVSQKFDDPNLYSYCYLESEGMLSGTVVGWEPTIDQAKETTLRRINAIIVPDRLNSFL